MGFLDKHIPVLKNTEAFQDYQTHLAEEEKKAAQVAEHYRICEKYRREMRVWDADIEAISKVIGNIKLRIRALEKKRDTYPMKSEQWNALIQDIVSERELLVARVESLAELRKYRPVNPFDKEAVAHAQVQASIDKAIAADRVVQVDMVK